MLGPVLALEGAAAAHAQQQQATKQSAMAGKCQARRAAPGMCTPPPLWLCHSCLLLSLLACSCCSIGLSLIAIMIQMTNASAWAAAEGEVEQGGVFNQCVSRV